MERKAYAVTHCGDTFKGSGKPCENKYSCSTDRHNNCNDNMTKHLLVTLTPTGVLLTATVAMGDVEEDKTVKRLSSQYSHQW